MSYMSKLVQVNLDSQSSIRVDIFPNVISPLIKSVPFQNLDQFSVSLANVSCHISKLYTQRVLIECIFIVRDDSIFLDIVVYELFLVYKHFCRVM